MKKKSIASLLLLLAIVSSAYPFSPRILQPASDSDSTILADSLNTKDETIKTGWSWGAVPAIAFDSDIGFKYGAVLELWDYGDGTKYPFYEHYFYFEYSNTTKGSQIFEFDYDSKSLIPGIRTSAEASYLTERALDFYGFNGYESYYNPDYEDDSWENRQAGNYRSRLYYRQERKLLRLRTDLQGSFSNEKFKWLAGITFYDINLDTINLGKLNKGTEDSLKLPSIGGGLYGRYAYDWNIIPDDQIHGGTTTLLKAGVVYDTRDNEANPMNGVWTEALLFVAPGFMGSGDYGFGKIALTHRQYFTLVPGRLSFVYRLAYQGKLWGNIPTYMMPLILNGGNAKDRDGLGGAKTVRGMLRNRVVGEGYLYGNFEFRWKFIKTKVFKQNVYLALNSFMDFGMVTGKYSLDLSDVPQENMYLFPINEDEKPHITAGLGFHIAINENFVIAINNGYALDPRDGTSGLYIGLKWLF